MDRGVAVGVVAGLVIGLSGGLAADNLIAGIAAGLALGAGLGLAFRGTRHSPDETTFDNLKHKQKGYEPGDRK